MDIQCKCGNNKFRIEDSGPHKKAISDKCNSYIKFLNKRELKELNIVVEKNEKPVKFKEEIQQSIVFDENDDDNDDSPPWD